LITRAELAPGRWEARSRPSVNQGYPDPPEDHWTESAAPWHQQAAARRKNQVEEGGRGAGLGLIGLLRVRLFFCCGRIGPVQPLEPKCRPQSSLFCPSV
jgi:hypothetical protein